MRGQRTTEDLNHWTVYCDQSHQFIVTCRTRRNRHHSKLWFQHDMTIMIGLDPCSCQCLSSCHLVHCWMIRLTQSFIYHQMIHKSPIPQSRFLSPRINLPRVGTIPTHRLPQSDSYKYLLSSPCRCTYADCLWCIARLRTVCLFCLFVNTHPHRIPLLWFYLAGGLLRYAVSLWFYII